MFKGLAPYRLPRPRFQARLQSERAVRCLVTAYRVIRHAGSVETI